MQQNQRTGTGGPAAGSQLERERNEKRQMIRNKEIQRDTGAAQGHGIGAGRGKGLGQQGKIRRRRERLTGRPGDCTSRS